MSMSTYHVYITESCKADMRHHNMVDAITAFAQKLEEEQSTHQLQRFPPPYLKKPFGKGRLVVEERCIDEDIVLCFVRYLMRGHSDYDSKFLHDSENFQKSNTVTHDEIERFLENRHSSPDVVSRTQPNEVETQYLQALSGIHYTEDSAILESYEWYERTSQSWVTDYLLRYYDLVQKIAGKIESGDDLTVLSHPINPKIKILYRHFPEYGKAFLIAQLNPDNQIDEEDLRTRYADILDMNRPVSEEILLRHSRRAYPAIMALDEDIWINIQKSEVANLALSPEEEKILESIRGTANNARRYPLFINGRPGSGKSTILQYLFAEHLAHHLVLEPGTRLAKPPLYLTYSDPLLAQAKNAVKNILQCGAQMQLKNALPNLNEEVQEIDKAFQNFRSFLLELLPAEERSRFVADRYVDFNKFKRLWEPKRMQHPNRNVRDISSELSWHAIRTYIKGIHHGDSGEIDPEYYSNELPRDRRSLTTATFSTIYDHVWERWYQPLYQNEGYWDDQDLARTVLDSSIDLSHYPVVFCDEAQDFTSLELELIQRLSLFSRRQILPYMAKDVPFAFAGDPFQTVNPTGFNWDSIKASFHDNIARQFDASGKANLEFNFQPLTFNYRSAEQIVKLGNLIQLFRGVVLGIKDLKPQETWTTSTREPVSPFSFRQEDVGWKRAVREQEELIIIVPCQEGGEREFVEQDPFLREIALRNGEMGRNILSPARAKGLEYDRVLLYRFGDHAAQQFPALMQRIAKPSAKVPDSEERLPWEYFLNQLYVAASRARKRLFIVDPEDGYERFWRFTAPEARRDLLSLYRSEQIWTTEVLGGIVSGDDESWSEDRDNPLQLAERFKQQGYVERDPYLLNLARHNYLRANRPEEAGLCEASALEFEAEYLKAGNRFVEFGRGADACRCFWSGQTLKEIISLVQKFPEIARDPRYLIANFLESKNQTWPQAAHILEQRSEFVFRELQTSTGELSAWSRFAGQFIEGLRTLAVQTVKSVDEVDQAMNHLRELLEQLGLPPTRYAGIAELLYCAGRPHKAIEHWRATAADKSARTGLAHTGSCRDRSIPS